MNPLSRRSPLAFLAVLVLAAPGFADPVPPVAGQNIPAKQLRQHTDPQFANLAANAKGDQKRIDAINLTQTWFNTAISNPETVPVTARFSLDDINRVGTSVSQVLDGVEFYQKSVADAKVLAASGDMTGANQKLAEGSVSLHASMSHLGMALVHAPPVDTEKANQTSQTSQTNQTNQGSEANPGTTAPAPSSVDLAAIVWDLAKKADNQVQCGSGIPTAPPSASVPIVPAGSAASPNGPNAVPPLNIPPLGQALGVDDPNSPTDALTDARSLYGNGDIAGGIADASRAIELGGGAPALALRGGMELDQKNYTAAHSDASQALQLDPSNKDAVAVYHLSESYAGVAAPKAPSFGGSAESGAVGGSRASAAGQVNAAQPQLSPAELRREIANALKLNDLSGALSCVNRALAQEPNNPSLLNIRASIESRMRDYAKSEADARAGLALAPRNPALLTTRTFAQLRGKKYKDALASANELIALDPKNAYAFALRAHAEGSMGDRDAMMSDLSRAAELDPRFAKAQAQMAGEVHLPSDKDILFLFPGEEAAPAAKTGAPEAGRGRRFGLLVGASALGGLLLALGLLRTVLAPITERLTSAFTRVAGPASAAAKNDTAGPASVNGLMPGLIRGQYEISRQIGMGGMGLVFAGTDRSLGRPVAIKKMREELRINPAERARFVIEAKTVAALHHPNIVDIYAIAEDGADVYLIFEFVDGKTVHDLVTREGRLPISDAARVVRAAADALGYAHSKGVIHRDMKPSNMMIDAAGRVKVMDFGIARMAKDSMTRYSMTNTVVGTPPYMAPEQEQGHVRRESDVYALAVCAYEMLTGKLPFVGIGAGMLMNKINMSYIAPSHAIAGLPEPLDEVFVKALQADPDKRYRTPKEFADALESALPAAARA